MFALVATPAIVPTGAASGSNPTGPLRLLDASTDAESVKVWVAAQASFVARQSALTRLLKNVDSKNQIRARIWGAARTIGVRGANLTSYKCFGLGWYGNENK